MKSQVADRLLLVPMTLSDLERRDARVKIFWRISIITPKLLVTEQTKFGAVIHVMWGSSVCLGGRHQPHPTRAGPKRPPIFFKDFRHMPKWFNVKRHNMMR